MEITVSLRDARKTMDIFEDGRWNNRNVEQIETNVYYGETEDIEDFLELLESYDIDLHKSKKYFTFVLLN